MIERIGGGNSAIETSSVGSNAAVHIKLDGKHASSEQVSTTSTLVQLAAIFLLFAVMLVCVFLSLPSFKDEKETSEILTLPRSLQQVKSMAHILSSYTQHSYSRVLFAIFSLYIFLQTFSVPGTIFLNVLCGALFGLPVAFCVTLIAGTLGASCAFLLSKLLGGSIIRRYFPDKLNLFRNQVKKHRNNLFFFMLFMRISPLLPNWFINICSPLIHIPFSHFFFATLIGIAPQTAISVNIGSNIFDLVDVNGSPINKSTILTLFGISFMSLIPVYLRRNSNNEIDGTATAPTVVKSEAKN